MYDSKDIVKLVNKKMTLECNKTIANPGADELFDLVFRNTLFGSAEISAEF